MHTHFVMSNIVELFMLITILLIRHYQQIFIALKSKDIILVTAVIIGTKHIIYYILGLLSKIIIL